MSTKIFLQSEFFLQSGRRARTTSCCGRSCLRRSIEKRVLHRGWKLGFPSYVGLDLLGDKAWLDRTSGRTGPHRFWLWTHQVKTFSHTGISWPFVDCYNRGDTICGKTKIPISGIDVPSAFKLVFLQQTKQQLYISGKFFYVTLKYILSMFSISIFFVCL